MIEEEWRDIEGYEGSYQVSDLGRVKSLDRTVIRSNGGRQPIKGRVMATSCHKRGYLKHTLQLQGIQKTKLTHRLVAIAFIPNPSNLPQVNHKTGVKGDNHVANLEWVSSRGNIRHAISTGLMDNSGENQTNSILKESDVVSIKKALKTPYIGLNVALAARYGVSKSTITDIKYHRSWKHVIID